MKRAKGDLHANKHSNQTHLHSTDHVNAVFSEGVALLSRECNTPPALPSYRRHVPMDNRHDMRETGLPTPPHAMPAVEPIA
jgi:hypothetical protein